MNGTSARHEAIQAHLTTMYGSAAAAEIAPRIHDLLAHYARRIEQPLKSRWDERDVVLISYADQVSGSDSTPLAALREFLVDHAIHERINTVHLLPFYPYTSDDGFSVVDYKQVDPHSGTWNDVAALGNYFNLAFDFVCNHCSQQSDWFQKYLNSESPYRDYFIDIDPSTDLSQVVRPRALPLLTPFESAEGTRHVWTTFSPDQVDLNFGSPEVLLAMLDVLLFYVAQGARIVRLDAIAFLWKEIGTNCLHLPQTHAAVKLMRAAVETVAPHLLILTETNVPHAENISYFGDADEAHMVYQFSLPPLLFDAYLTGDATVLTDWMDRLYDIPVGTTFFNFTASHDGIGVRPLEGIVPTERFDALVEATRQRGGLVGLRTMPDGSRKPYELNVTYVDAMRNPSSDSPELHARRFLASQAIMLAMKGIPGIYFHSLVGTQNHTQGVDESGINRRINRRKFDRAELDQILNKKGSLQERIFSGYLNLLRWRISHPAFHPDGASRVIRAENTGVFGFLRLSPDGRHHVLVLANLTSDQRTVSLSGLDAPDCVFDLISQSVRASGGAIQLEPFQIVWLTTPSS